MVCSIDQGLKKDEALRQAKLQYIQSAKGTSAPPASWAPFIMIGKIDPIEIQRKSNSMAWVIGLGVLALLGIRGVMLRKKAA